MATTIFSTIAAPVTTGLPWGRQRRPPIAYAGTEGGNNSIENGVGGVNVLEIVVADFVYQIPRLGHV